MLDTNEREDEDRKQNLVQDNSCQFITQMRDFFGSLEHDWQAYRSRKKWNTDANPRRIRQLEVQKEAASKRVKVLRASSRDVQQQLAEARAQWRKQTQAYEYRIDHLEHEHKQAQSQQVVVGMRRSTECTHSLQEDRAWLAEGFLFLEGQEEAIKEKRDFIEARHGELETLREKLEARHGELETLRGKLEARHGELEALHEQIEARREEVEARHKKTEARCGELEVLHEQLEARNGQLDARNEELEGLHGKLEALHGKLETDIRRFDSCHGELGEWQVNLQIEDPDRGFIALHKESSSTEEHDFVMCHAFPETTYDLP
jgi:chromosome segregation ATPase